MEEPFFRFATGDRVRVITHPARPLATVVERWPPTALRDVHEETIYAVTGFVTRQRESSLAAEGWEPIPLEPVAAWRMAGRGAFRRVGPGVIESDGGPGVLWWPREELESFLLTVDWRASSPDANSGVFVRVPPLGDADPEHDWLPAVHEGYEAQIDDRGVDPATQTPASAWHRTGAVYGLAPAGPTATRPPGRWNTLAIAARGPSITVAVNGVPASELREGSRRARGHVGLQAHHPGSRVAFRNLQVRRL